MVRRIFAFEGDGVIRQYEGGYTDYVNRKKAQEAVSLQKTSAGKDSVSGKGNPSGNDSASGKNSTSGKENFHGEKKLKFSYNEQREYETIEEDIEKLESKIEELEADILKNASNFVKLNELTNEKMKAEAALEEKMERWEYLEDLAERIQKQKEAAN